LTEPISPAAPQVWNPKLYLTYEAQRLRPALDLLARVPLTAALRVTDLGCGAGNAIPHLCARFPAAIVTGVDSSPEMLATARAAYSKAADWLEADAARWQPATPQDLIFSNAVLHWLDGHDTLFPRLMGFLVPGGVLAVQMPNQFDEPSHAVMRDVAANGPWAQALKPLLRPAPVADAQHYFDRLSPVSAHIDIWQTQYVQVMDGDDAVLNWIASTALKPLLEALTPDLVEPFRRTLAEKLRVAYPKRANGKTLFPFKRLFIVAVRGRGEGGKE
jgi:trans-aconitate 2-methyltransferase